MAHLWIAFVKKTNSHTGCRSRQDCARLLQQLVEHMNADFALTPMARVYVKSTKQVMSATQTRLLWPIKIFCRVEIITPYTNRQSNCGCKVAITKFWPPN